MLAAYCPCSTRCKRVSPKTERERYRLIRSFPLLKACSAAWWALADGRVTKKFLSRKVNTMENKLCNTCFLNHARKGRGWAEGQSSEFRELEKLLILLSNGTEISSGCYSSPAPPHPPGHLCVDLAHWRNMLSCAQSQQKLKSSPRAMDLWNKIALMPEQH